MNLEGGGGGTATAGEGGHASSRMGPPPRPQPADDGGVRSTGREPNVVEDSLSNQTI